ncbi:helix-turn-helix domain-containing protein [Streptomyces sp. MMG1121]|uniref:helix-turn-helix domain-containing protein n=1 Tax=Streptomyces sp. MMG1121 TaxID=1415544 RepID=UPI002D21A2F7|nr:helix-turn-helix domain-containing protein [Streptomyces sp. MMG1121]
MALRARMVELSWSGQRVLAIADESGCNPRTVRLWLHRLDRFGRVGRPLSGRLTVWAGGEPAAADQAGPPEWTLGALAAEARRLGIENGRNQVRRIPLDAEVRCRRTWSWPPPQSRPPRGSTSPAHARWAKPPFTCVGPLTIRQ